MPKFTWKVVPVKEGDLEVMAASLERELNGLEQDGFDVQKLELRGRGVLLTGRRPARPKAA